MIGEMPFWLRVRPGDLIEARLVVELLHQIEERTITAGVNCRVISIPGQGVSIEGIFKPQNFAHPWTTGIKGDQATIAPGLVNGVVPYIDKNSMDGLDEKGSPLASGVPTLKMDQTLFDTSGRSWICLQAKVDPKTGKLLDVKDGGLKIIQAKEIFIGAGGAEDKENTGLWPLSLLRRPASATAGYGKVYDVTYFNLNHRYVAAASGKGFPRHFFWV